MIDLSVRPTKVDRASDVTGLVDTGELASLLSLDDTVAVMEAIQRISDRKLQRDRPEAALGRSRSRRPSRATKSCASWSTAAT